MVYLVKQFHVHIQIDAVSFNIQQKLNASYICLYVQNFNFVPLKIISKPVIRYDRVNGSISFYVILMFRNSGL